MEDQPANISDTPLFLNALSVDDESEWHFGMIQYITKDELPSEKKLAQKIRQNAPNFHVGHLEDNKILIQVYKDGCKAPYLEPKFQLNLVHQYHKEFGHLGHLGLQGVI